MGRNVDLRIVKLAASDSFDLPIGFFMASILPASGGSWTVTNSLGEESDPITVPFTFPSSLSMGPVSWQTHTITAIGQEVQIVYTSAV